MRHVEGTLHGFLAIKTLDGTVIASGDLVQTVRGDQVSARLVFHFKDASIDDESTLYSQTGVFRLIKCHHVQKGPSFPHPMDLTINASANQVELRTKDEDGKEKVSTEHMDLPDDVSNGIISTLLKNLGRDVPQTKLSLVVAAPKPRLVTITISPDGEERMSVAGLRRKAWRYRVKFELGGLVGAVAPLVGKHPKDVYVWILNSEVPAFLRSQGPTHSGGPVWMVELASPTWLTSR